MTETGRMERLDSLNRAFDKAFSHTASKETLRDLLECMGEELLCDRISIFELNMDKTCDNTYEWCRPGKTHMKDLMQSLPLSIFHYWMEDLMSQEFISIRDLERVRENEPEVYNLLHSQEVNAVIAARLAFHGKNIGFFILENPGDAIMNDASTVMPGMRYILSSLVYSDHLLRRLERIGYLDHLTNTGNRMGLQEALTRLEPEKPLGLVYCEVLGWSNEDHRLTSIQEEQALIRAGDVLQGMFGEDNVFRVAADEFLVLCTDVDEASMDMQMHSLRHLFDDHGLLVAVGTLFEETPGSDHDSMIRQAHLRAHNEIRALTRSQMERSRMVLEEKWGEDEIANISLYRMDEFFRQAPKHFGEFYDEFLLTIIIDINYFKLYNDIFGRKAGSLLLEQVSKNILDFSRRYLGISGYLGGDNFIIILPTRRQNEEEIIPMVRELEESIQCPDGFSPAMGLYLSRDKQETLVAMYDHALTALQDIKGSYVDHFRFYDVEHYRRDRETKMLMLDAKRGLQNGEFLFYLQPQVNERDGRIVGAEALCRWINRGQLVSPAQFVPAMEKSGYIYAMDCYIWEEVCRWLRKMKDRGIRPVPVSINVSRIDFYFDDIAEHIINLTKKYDIEPYLLGVEITESAFTDNTDVIVEAVHKLHDAGFRVLMDDFGSGSSSLSMLHTISLDVLKTDVRFMSRDERNSRAYSIVGSVVSMAHMIGMIVVTEGVETEQQRQNLVAMGGNFAQGFFFYHPMPVEQFEQLLQDPEKIAYDFSDHGLHAGENHLRFREMIGNGMFSEPLLDNILGPAAIYRVSQENITIPQTSEQYRRMAWAENGNEHSDRILTGTEEAFRHLFLEADKRPFEGAVTTVPTMENGEIKQHGIRAFLLYTCEEYRLYFLVVQENGQM